MRPQQQLQHTQLLIVRVLCKLQSLLNRQQIAVAQCSPCSNTMYHKGRSRVKHQELKDRQTGVTAYLKLGLG